MEPRRLAAVAATLVLALFLSACPADGGEQVTPTGSASVPVVPTGDPVQGGTLVIAVDEIDSLDPGKAESRPALSAISQIFQPLTEVDPVTGELLPGAAKRWTVSKDGLTWRFILAKRRFHDDSLVRSRDFKFAFDRISRRDTRSESAFQLEQVRGFRKVKIEGVTQKLSGVSAPESDVLVIKLARPFSELGFNLAHPALVPLREVKYAKNDASLRRAPIGNGPFRVGKANAKLARLVAWGKYEGDAKPYLEAIEYQVVRNVDIGWRKYRSGTVQVTEVPPSAIDGGGSLFGQGGFTPFWATLSFGFNTKRGVFRKAEVRRAFSLAIDRSAIAKTVYGGTRDPATGILPAGIRGFVENACDACELDLSRARQIIRAAFPKKRPTIGLDILDERSSRQVAKALRADIKRLGFTVKIRAHSRDDYLPVLERGGHDIAQLGWLSDVPSPDAFLHQQLRTRQLNNHTGWSNETFDTRLDRARDELDPDARLDLYTAAERLALREMPLIPIVFFRNRTAVASEVHGFALDGAGFFRGEQVWIDP